MILRALKWLAGGDGVLRQPRRLEWLAGMNAGYARASATAAAREIDPANPLSWEFSGFSQHGEDGIVDYLCRRMIDPNRYFVEIGSADGLHNCSAWLAYARRFGGVMVEADSRQIARAAQLLRFNRCHNVVTFSVQVTRENIAAVLRACPHADPDVFIIDIDGIDLHIVERVLALDFRPKLLVVEYNSVFGPDRPVTVPYAPDFSRHRAHASLLYYGASIAAWQHLLGRAGYDFVTVDSSGTNAFFIDPSAFPSQFASGLAGLTFRDNQSDRNGATEARRDSDGAWIVPKRAWEEQLAHIQDLPLETVSDQPSKGHGVRRRN